MPTLAPPDIDSAYPLTADHVNQFAADGFIKLKQVFDQDTLDYYADAIREEVKAMTENVAPLTDRTLYGKAFLQCINLFERNARIREFVFGKRLARIATDLLGTSGVRLYHDQALFKEPGGGYTPWHVDQVYWPLSSDRTVTAWVPLQPVPLEKGPLCFAKGSHRLQEGRDLIISEESERFIGERMKLSDFPVDETPFDLGEVSFHLGFLFHRAGPNQTTAPREVMTVIYMDSEMRLTEATSDAQRNDTRAFCPGIAVGEKIDSPKTPVLYSR